MKNVSIFYVLLAIAIVACDSSTELNKKEDSSKKTVEFNPPNSVFKGSWIWVETNGVDFDGQSYKQDPKTEGYNLRYQFSDTEANTGKLLIYRDLGDEINYLYEYTNSETGNPLLKKLTLDRMTNSAPELFFWEINYKQVEDKYVGHLYLRNAAYFTDGCCDGKIEYHFELEV